MGALAVCGGRPQVEVGVSEQLNWAIECKDGMQKEFGQAMKPWCKHLIDHPPSGCKVLMFTWANAKRCACLMIFESPAQMSKFQSHEYVDMQKVAAPYAHDDKSTLVFESGKIWKTRSRVTAVDGASYLRIWSYSCQPGKEPLFEMHWADHFNKYRNEDIDWQLYSVARSSPSRFLFAMVYRIGSVVDRYNLDELDSVNSGPLSMLVDGPPHYNDFWILEGMTYPHHH